MGGSDQWGNIVTGVDLGRRMGTHQLYALTCPLLTTSSGAKMGKTAAGAVWLNEDQLSAYDYWQYWRNTEDARRRRLLKMFTALPLAEIAKLAALQGAEINEAKKVLATEATALLHGREKAEAAARTAQETFEQGATSEGLPTVEIAASELAAGLGVLAAFVKAGLVKSNGEARRQIQGGGLRVNDAAVTDESAKLSPGDVSDGVIKLSLGRKRHVLLQAGVSATATRIRHCLAPRHGSIAIRLLHVATCAGWRTHGRDTAGHGEGVTLGVRRTRRIERLDRVGIELEVRGGDQVLELIQVGGAGDRGGDAGARHQPGERHLRRVGLQAGGDLVQRLEDAQAALVEMLLHAAAARALLEVGLRAVLAGQEPLASAVVGDDADVLLQHSGSSSRLVVGAVVEVVERLQGLVARQLLGRADFERLAEARRVVVGGADGAHLALLRSSRS